MSDTVVGFAYLVASVLFILSLNSPRPFLSTSSISQRGEMI